MKIGIIGQGFVGTAVYEGLKNYYNIEKNVESLLNLLNK